mmetsp:Transcript_8732/g.21904  ORF Transcript_8732/g.21904 Transcript_8732/m.21904 type:complete len:115 (+) Transcript_8732:1517-1861(+)
MSALTYVRMLVVGADLALSIATLPPPGVFGTYASTKEAIVAKTTRRSVVAANSDDVLEEKEEEEERKNFMLLWCERCVTVRRCCETLMILTVSFGDLLIWVIDTRKENCDLTDR